MTRPFLTDVDSPGLCENSNCGIPADLSENANWNEWLFTRQPSLLPLTENPSKFQIKATLKINSARLHRHGCIYISARIRCHKAYVSPESRELNSQAFCRIPRSFSRASERANRIMRSVRSCDFSRCVAPSVRALRRIASTGRKFSP